QRRREARAADIRRPPEQGRPPGGGFPDLEIGRPRVVSGRRTNGKGEDGQAGAEPPAQGHASRVMSRKAMTSVNSSTCSESGVPPPWPDDAPVRRRIGASLPDAAWRRAIIFLLCQASTRGSFSPASMRTGG